MAPDVQRVNMTDELTRGREAALRKIKSLGAMVTVLMRR